MINIQEILDKIRNSEIAKPNIAGGLGNVGKRNPLYVFHNSRLIETCVSMNEAKRKYGKNLVHKVLCRNRPINNYYFSKNNEYKPSPPWEHSGRIGVHIINKNHEKKTFNSLKECSEFLNIPRSLLTNIKSGVRKLPKRITDVKEIIFEDL